MTREEYKRLIAEDGRARPPARGSAPRPTWDDVAASYDAEVRKHTGAQAHFAVARLLALVLSVHQGDQDPAAALPAAERDAALDADNLVARLAHAVVADFQATAATDGGMVPLDRFRQIQGIVEADHPAGRATLYNGEFLSLWGDVLRRYVRRPGVAETLAIAAPRYLVHDHYAGLPVVQERLTGLADELRDAGHDEAAERCRQWIARLALGLMEADAGAGTRLLCVDLLVRSLGDQSAIAASLQEMRRDFHAVAARAPIDLADQSFTPRPSVAPEEYGSAFLSLVAACGFCLIALGGGAMFILGCIAAAFARLARPCPSAGLDLAMPLYVKLPVAAMPSVAVTMAATGWLDAGGAYSQSWLLTIALLSPAVGALMAMVLAGLKIPSDAPVRRLRICITIAMALLLLATTALSPELISRAYRRIDLTIAAPWALGLGLSAVVLAGLVICPARFRTLAASAALVWSLNAAIALSILQYHRAADRRYQQAVVANCMDEFTARLGPDWREKYLKPALDAYDTPKP